MMRKLISVILAVASIVCTSSSLAATSNGALDSASRNDKTSLESLETNVTSMPAFRGGDKITFNVEGLTTGKYLTVISYKLNPTELTDATIQYVNQYTVDEATKTIEYRVRNTAEEGIYKLSFSGNETDDGSSVVNFYYKVGNPVVTMVVPDDATYWNWTEYKEDDGTPVYAVGFVAKAVVGSNDVSLAELGVESLGIKFTANGKELIQTLTQEQFDAISTAQKYYETDGSVAFVYGLTVYGIESEAEANSIVAEAYKQDKPYDQGDTGGKITYGEGENDFVIVDANESFTLPVASKVDYEFLGYFTEDDVQVTDAEGKRLTGFILTSDITVVAKFNRLKSDADTATGQLLGNPSKDYYKATTFATKISLNPQDLMIYDGKLYLSGGYCGGGWVPAPPMNVYDTETGEWGNVDFAVKMYEALDPDSDAKSWHELPSTKSDSDNVKGAGAGVAIPVTTDCEISNFKLINGKPMALGGDSIQGYTWADGTVSQKKASDVDATDTQKSVYNAYGNYYTIEEDEDGNERWVEYRNNVTHALHVFDVAEIDYNGEKTLMFAIGGNGGAQLPAKILTNKETKTYLSPKLYLKDGSEYTVTATDRHHRFYNFFETDEGIFAFYDLHGDNGNTRKIFKYNFTNNEHRFDEVRDIEINPTTSDTKNYQQSDVNSSGTAIDTRRLWTSFMKTETYNGYAYYTTGYLYKTKTFEKSATTKITAPNSAIVTDLAVRDGKLYALGFVKTDSTTNAYTNYIWSIDANDNFTQIRTFTSTGAYALSFDKDEDFFYVGLGGPTTHITSDVANVGNLLKLSINPIQ